MNEIKKFKNRNKIRIVKGWTLFSEIWCRHCEMFKGHRKTTSDRNAVERLYVSRSKGGRELMKCEIHFVHEESNFGWHVEHQVKRLIIGV